jgi:hypothetical protein
VLGEICPSATLSIENPTWTDWSLKADLRCEMLATESLNSIMATTSRVKDNKIKAFRFEKIKINIFSCRDLNSSSEVMNPV